MNLHYQNMYLKQSGGKMKEIDEKELANVKGGGLSAWTFFAIGAAVVFVIGIFDGYTRPLGCNKQVEVCK